MNLSYAMYTEYVTSPRKKGNCHTLPRQTREEIELVPCDKEANGPYTCLVQITASDFTTAVFDLRKLCWTVGVGDNRRSLLPDCLRALLVDSGIIFSLCGGENDWTALKILFGLDSRKNRPGDGKNCFGYLELQDWAWSLNYKLYSKAMEEQGPQPMAAALWRLVALGLGFPWKVDDANDDVGSGQNGLDFLS